MDITNYSFETMFPSYKDKIVDSTYLGDFETIFYINDGTKVIFDEINKTAKYIKPRSNTETELSKEEWLNEFSRKLRVKLSRLNMTGTELSSKTGISTNTLYRYIRGERVPDIFSINKITKALGCKIEDLTNFDYLL